MLKRSPKTPKQLTPEQLGKMLVNIYESGYLDHNTTYKMSFIKGVVGGLGGVLGATIVVALLLWALSLFHYVPVLNRISDNVRNTVQQPNTK
jgi:phage shock protein PspC (stress-responsive transcriptional regulator)